MNTKLLATVIVLASSSLAVSVKAQQPETQVPAKLSNQVLNACVQNKAETLPNPFSDVPNDHWAFKAVMTMYYCGAYRQATPPALLQPSPTENQQQSLQKQQVQQYFVGS
ncbi:S-layer protein [Fischerella thermalis CCMEE 5268]|uniref:S-layer protein n=1 Tax=Fischerella thermalis CCMEE 5268 TaxID=2019662 RepID=A0A2N6KF12_9CYAN|nr:S-layer protein [Fischerella thermalis]PLZ97671.1 S-layer protein [Fischerella thermalis CCMEE 5268]PMB50287.1 S-layer protein [Fischerella thermalis CCMEE 5205]